MNWTKEKPTAPGMYWFLEPGEKPVICEVTATNNGAEVEFFGYGGCVPVDGMSAKVQWFGPLPRPTEPTAGVEVSDRDAAMHEMTAYKTHLESALSSIAHSSCCADCQEARRVARAALNWPPDANPQQPAKEAP